MSDDHLMDSPMTKARLLETLRRGRALGRSD